jgi:hypothetical protein
MRYIVKARLVITQPFEDIPVVAALHRFRLPAILNARAMNKMSGDYSIQWYALDTQTGKVYV